jgi:hypothetical protein
VATYAHPGPQRIPGRKRCKTKHSPKIPARCKLPRDHEGDHRFGWFRGDTIAINLDLQPPKPIGQRGTDAEHADDDRFAMLALIREFLDIDGRECVAGQWECGTHAYPTEEAGEACPYTQAREMLAAHEPEIQARRKAQAAETFGQIQDAMEIFGGGK